MTMGLLENGFIRIILLLVFITGLSYAGYRGVQFYRTKITQSVIELALEKGYPAVAADEADKKRELLLETPEGCALMIDSFFRGRMLQKLDWASQACLARGHSIVEGYLGWAAVRTFENRENEALSILQEAAQKFEKSAAVYLRMAEIFRKNKNEDSAVQAYAMAIQRAPDDIALALNTLEYFRLIKRTELVKQLSLRLKDFKTTQPEVKMIIARALKESGEPSQASKLVEEAKEMTKENPDAFTRLAQNYPELSQSTPKVVSENTKKK
jgi:tetratricopeptide (TPR) repeat protein